MHPEAPKGVSDAQLTIKVRQSTFEWLKSVTADMGLRSAEAVAGRLLDELALPTEDP